MGAVCLAAFASCVPLDCAIARVRKDGRIIAIISAPIEPAVAEG